MYFFTFFFQKFQKVDGKSDDKNNYTKTARILILFVLAYIVQWWPLVVFTFWSYFENPHIAIVEVRFFCHNLFCARDVLAVHRN